VNDGMSRCAHGAQVNRLDPLGDGWFMPYADECKACNGKPAGLKFKPGKPAPSMQAVEPESSRRPSDPWFGVFAPSGCLLAIFPTAREAILYARGANCARFAEEPYVFRVQGSAKKCETSGPEREGFVVG